MIARSIFLGIHNYFKDFPIEGTFSENYIGHVTYTIQKGDVLSEIAIRFGVTVNEILDLPSMSTEEWLRDLSPELGHSQMKRKLDQLLLRMGY